MTPEQRQALKDTLTPVQAGALTVYGEARNQPVSGLQAVLSVIRNRVNLGKWGPTWAQTVLAPMQFSCWNDDDPNSSILYDLSRSLLSPSTVLRAANPVLDVCLMMAERMVENIYTSNVGGSTHYYAPAAVSMPKWAAPPARRVTMIGGHAFYVGVK